MAHAAEGTISSPVTEAECQSMPYLQAVIKEAMRLYPPLTALAFKTVPPEGDTISGYYLPAGTQVGQNIYGILRDVDFWGQDANIFLPERWCDLDRVRGMEMESVLDLTFGWGKYKCLGRRLALAEVNKFLVEV
jgi:cytochrome P450